MMKDELDILSQQAFRVNGKVITDDEPMVRVRARR
jgi:hypothetical protein